ncbi:hypothetical protein HHL16_17250 [Pseudoflavitalea sp. G-6-1-2]|uniref:MbnP family protein n=1 Tax=Pseudoflavitalea sp. G-6-1-2 TaxID=2728841 RepID=UPI00146DB14B|nr:MbnP family protein [Pseudoflavitalea sp. G-6-1-2]NML22633.1 hypothetical protein [Pseudoflavitalea sp. G-6-1-2]
MRPALILLLLFVSLTAANRLHRPDAPKGFLELQFHHFIGKKILHSDSTYLNHFNEPFTVTKFRYYVSNIVVSNSATGKQYRLPDTYFLVNEAEPASKSIRVVVPAGGYDTISFLLGVDSLRNTSGAQTGALDPLNDMFWTWNTGYVMAKLEGSSPLSKLPHHLIEYHIGGYKKPHAVQQLIALKVPAKAVQVKSSGMAKVAIHADLDKWFYAKHPLKIADQPACTTPGALAVKYAENYAQLFFIHSIKQP